MSVHINTHSHSHTHTAARLIRTGSLPKSRTSRSNSCRQDPPDSIAAALLQGVTDCPLQCVTSLPQPSSEPRYSLAEPPARSKSNDPPDSLAAAPPRSVTPPPKPSSDPRYSLVEPPSCTYVHWGGRVGIPERDVAPVLHCKGIGKYPS